MLSAPRLQLPADELPPMPVTHMDTFLKQPRVVLGLTSDAIAQLNAVFIKISAIVHAHDKRVLLPKKVTPTSRYFFRFAIRDSANTWVGTVYLQRVGSSWRYDFDNEHRAFNAANTEGGWAQYTDMPQLEARVNAALSPPLL